MNNFLITIESKGWDKFLLDIKNEFKNIRENLSIVESQDFMVVTMSSNKSTDILDIANKIKTKDEIKKEFVKLREELKIDSFNI